MVAVTLAVAAAATAAAAAARANRLVSGVGKIGCRKRCLTCDGLMRIASQQRELICWIAMDKVLYDT